MVPFSSRSLPLIMNVWTPLSNTRIIRLARTYGESYNHQWFFFAKVYMGNRQVATSHIKMWVVMIYPYLIIAFNPQVLSNEYVSNRYCRYLIRIYFKQFNTGSLIKIYFNHLTLFAHRDKMLTIMQATFADVFLNEYAPISIKVSLKFFPCLRTQICVTWPRWAELWTVY